MYNVNKIRKDFPILTKTVNGKPLIYFDNGATTQKPKVVIESIVKFYSEQNANIHRGVHTLSREATVLFENARKTVANFINANPDEVIFTAGTTDGINIVAGGLNLPAGSEIIITEMEHHSNILPWQLWCEKNKGKLKVIPVNSDGTLQIEKLKELITPKTAVLALTHVSNTLGVINNVKEIISKARDLTVRTLAVLVDGAQSVPHMPINVKDLDADFFVFSGHKMYAPTGIGVLWAKANYINSLQLSKAGGGTIKTVSFERTEYAEGPIRFEPGTPNIEGALGLAAAIRYMEFIGTPTIAGYEHKLLEYATTKLNELPEVEIYANHLKKASVISFNVKGSHPFDVGTILDMQGIAVRTGHHCTQPLMKLLKIQGTVRASFSFYNTIEEIDVFITAVKKAIKMLK